MISIRKLVIYSGISISLIVLVWILFSSEDSSEKERKSKEADSVALLLGGGSPSSGSGSSGGKTNESIFDSSFYKSGKGEYIESDKGEPKEADPNAADADNPVNPQTNKPYTNEEMERFSQLRERFPDNSLIPKKLSPAEKEAKRQEDSRIAEAARNVLQGRPLTIRFVLIIKTWKNKLRIEWILSIISWIFKKVREKKRPKRN